MESEPPDVVKRLAPDLYFGRLEKWFPTDPREYKPDSSRTVDGFDALNQYTADLERTGEPPAPMVFYHVTEAAVGVDAIQYWMYSVFDQFTVNFHWHDWELLQVFVDQETGHPLLLSASAHSGKSRTTSSSTRCYPTADARGGVLEELDVALQKAEAALSATQQGSAGRANVRLSSTITPPEEALELLLSDRQDGYSDSAVAALGPMILESIGRAEEAIETELAGR